MDSLTGSKPRPELLPSCDLNFLYDLEKACDRFLLLGLSLKFEASLS